MATARIGVKYEYSPSSRYFIIPNLFPTQRLFTCFVCVVGDYAYETSINIGNEVHNIELEVKESVDMVGINGMQSPYLYITDNLPNFLTLGLLSDT